MDVLLRAGSAADPFKSVSHMMLIACSITAHVSEQDR